MTPQNAWDGKRYDIALRDPVTTTEVRVGPVGVEADDDGGRDRPPSTTSAAYSLAGM